MVSYCTPENGYEIGASGRRYDGVCPVALESDFLQGLDRGREERRQAALVHPNVNVGVGVGIGSRGRVRTGIGVGIGIGHFGLYSGHRYRY